MKKITEKKNTVTVELTREEYNTLREDQKLAKSSAYRRKKLEEAWSEIKKQGIFKGVDPLEFQRIQRHGE